MQGLDPASRRNLWDVVKNAKRNRGIILTTHSMEEAEVRLHTPAINCSFRPCTPLPPPGPPDPKPYPSGPYPPANLISSSMHGSACLFLFALLCAFCDLLMPGTSSRLCSS